MTPELYQLQAFMEKLKDRNIPRIIEACFDKIRSLEQSGNQGTPLGEHLKSVVLLLKHLRRPADLPPEFTEYLRQYLTKVMEKDRRAKHALEVLKNKM